MENYKILNKIGEGYGIYIYIYMNRTYGLVFKAIQKETEEIVAIKQFKESDEDEQVSGL